MFLNYGIEKVRDFSVFFSVLLLFCLASSVGIAEASSIQLSGHLEKKQWGTLEDLLKDYGEKKITLDECALYGCYILAAMEPSRIDRFEKCQLVPERYTGIKSSEKPGPYFFVNFLYENESRLGPAAALEFACSDWYYGDFLEDFKKSRLVSGLIDKLKPDPGKGAIARKNIYSILKASIVEGLMSGESAFLVFSIFRLNSIYYSKNFFERNSEFLKKNGIDTSSFDENIFFISVYLRYAVKTKNQRIANIISYCLEYCGDSLLNVNNLGATVNEKKYETADEDAERYDPFNMARRLYNPHYKTDLTRYFTGNWYYIVNGVVNSTMTVRKNGEIFDMTCAGTHKWEGVGYIYRNKMLVIFQYMDIDDVGFSAMELSSDKKVIKILSLDIDGKFRCNVDFQRK